MFPMRWIGWSMMGMVGACSNPAGSPAAESGITAPVAVTIPSSEFTLPAAGNGPLRVPFSYKNSLTTTTYVQRCGERIRWSVERFGTGTWEPISEFECRAVLMPSLVVQASQQVPDTALIGIPGSSIKPGTYRIVLFVYSTPLAAADGNSTMLLADSLRVSNPFLLR